MTNSRRPLYHDYQPPELFRTGCTLRASFRTGDDATPVEKVLMMRIDQPDEALQDAETTVLVPKP